MILFFLFFFQGFYGLSKGVSQNICLRINASWRPCVLAPGRCLVAAVKPSYFTGGLQLPDFPGGGQASRDSCVNMTKKKKGWKCHRLWKDERPFNLPVPPALNLSLDFIILSGSFLEFRKGRPQRSGLLVFQNLQQISHLSEVTLPDTNIIFSPWRLLSIYF